MRIIIILFFTFITWTAIATENPVTVTNILTTEKAWSGAKLPGYTSSKPQLLVNHFVIKPGGVTSVHLHPSNGAGYIISGELTMYATSDPSGSFENKSEVKSISLKAGEAFSETVNTWHYGVNNGDEDVVFVVVFASEKGAPATLSQ